MRSVLCRPQMEHRASCAPPCCALCHPLASSQKGTALIFPTATLEGLADERYLHSGEPVGKGDKWIAGTWLMETERSDAKQVQQAIKLLVNL